MFNLTPKSIGIFVMAQVNLRIFGSGAIHLVFLRRLIVSVQNIRHDPTVDWDICCGPGGVENQWLRRFFNVGFFYQRSV